MTRRVLRLPLAVILLSMFTSLARSSPRIGSTTYLPGVFQSPPPPVKGVAIGDQRENQCAHTFGVAATWLHAGIPDPDPCMGLDTVPMIPDLETGARVLSGTVSLSGSSQWVIGYTGLGAGGFHEAALQWGTLQTALRGRLIVSPSPAEIEYDWWEGFYQAYVDHFLEPPHFDAIGAHCAHMDVPQCGGVIQRRINVAKDLDVPEVWVVYFNPLDTTEDVLLMLEWMRDEPMITRIAYGPNCCDGRALYASDGSLTERGAMYRYFSIYE